MVDRRAVRDRGCGRVWIRVDDFVAPLFALADYGGDTAQDAFAFSVCAFLGVAVEDFCGGGEAGFTWVCLMLAVC